MSMFDSLNEVERKCQDLEKMRETQQEFQEINENDRVYKELQEQDKKIHELKELVKYLTIEKKRRGKINTKCRQSKQRKLNENYNIVNTLNKDGFLKDNSIEVDLDLKNSKNLKEIISKLKNTNNSSISNSQVKCDSMDPDYVDLDKVDLKCYNCDKEKILNNKNYINRDFN